MASKSVLSNEKGFIEKIHQGNASLLSNMNPHLDFEQSESCCPNSIPRIAHFIWIGSRPLPDYGQRCINLFRFYHPNWTVMMWTNNEIQSDPELSVLIQDVYNEGKASDLLRYVILARLGGVYVDVDYEFVGCLETIPGLFDTRSGNSQSTVKFFCGLSNTSMIEVNNGILGCAANHPIMRELCQAVRQNHQRSMAMAKGILGFLPPSERKSTLVALQIESPEGILLQTGPLMLTLFLDRIMTKYSLQDLYVKYGILILPPRVFHPVPNKAKVMNLINCLPQFDNALLENEDQIEARMLSCAYPSKTETFQMLDQLICNQESYELILGNQSAMTQVNWSDYYQLKECFVNNDCSTTIAIHWWQRSWQ